MQRNRTKALETIEIGEGKYTKIVERIKYLANNEVYSIETFSEYIESINSWKVKAVLTIEEDGKLLVYLKQDIAAQDLNSYLFEQNIVLEHLVKRKNIIVLR